MANLKLTDWGGQDILLEYLTAGGLTLEIFVDAGGLTDEQADREPAEGNYEVDLDSVDYEITEIGGVPAVVWDPVVITFTGPLSNAVNKTVRGYSVMKTTVAHGAINIWEQLLPAGYTPTGAGDKLTITPRFMLGNVPAGGLPV